MENWKKIEIGSVAKINKASLTEKTSSDYEFFYIDIASVNNGKITFPTEKIQFKNAPSRARRIVQKDDILMATVRPNLQSFAHFSFEKDNVIASTGFAVLRANEKIDSKFLYYSIFSEHISKQVSLLIAGSNYPAINSSEVANLIIYLPSNLPEQKKIAAILSTWDSAIETTAKLIAAKQVRKRALMQRLLTGKQRFPQFIGQAWETLKIQKIIN
jgi:type I restriction enzyme, S subunit